VVINLEHKQRDCVSRVRSIGREGGGELEICRGNDLARIAMETKCGDFLSVFLQFLVHGIADTRVMMTRIAEGRLYCDTV
jgi:hypothetical protein